MANDGSLPSVPPLASVTLLGRAFRFTIWAQWLALVLAVIPAVWIDRGGPASLIASAVAGVYVLASNVIPVERLNQRFFADGFALASALLCMGAVILTDAKDSPFVLLSLIPPIQATLLGGARTGASTGALSGALLVAAQLSQDAREIIPAIGIAVIYLVVVATMIQLIRILGDISTLAAATEAKSLGIEAKLASLEEAHRLLSELARMGSEGMSLPDQGRQVLESIDSVPELRSSEAVLFAPNGSIVVARSGDVSAASSATSIPLTVGERSVGEIRVGHEVDGLSIESREKVETLVRPLALAFANSLLLDELVHQAVTRERTRVARDLHDEIGPSLASLGLSIDVALMSHRAEPALAAHMQSLRDNVSELISDVRATMTDLRTEPTGALGRHLADAIGPWAGPAQLEVAFQERRPPRPGLLPDLVGIIAEAVRNASRHSGASTISIEGWADFDRGAISIVDNGAGFDPVAEYPGHYGLIGMRERAIRAGLDVGVASGQVGTTVKVSWGLS
jgi:signal transduction histidine kinase